MFQHKLLRIRHETICEEVVEATLQLFQDTFGVPVFDHSFAGRSL
jgi:hypothetical protein